MTIKLKTFKAFAAERDVAGDWHRFIAPSGTKLVRTKICTYCQFPRSTIYQDEVIVQFLDGIERRLRQKGILKAQHEQPTADTIDELEEVMERTTSDLLARAEALVAKCNGLAEKLHHLAQYHPAYPAGDK